MFRFGNGLCYRSVLTGRAGGSGVLAGGTSWMTEALICRVHNNVCCSRTSVASFVRILPAGEV